MDCLNPSVKQLIHVMPPAPDGVKPVHPLADAQGFDSQGGLILAGHGY
jgi:hypothetical protein